ncbi:MAG: hypothetical protein M3081_14750 [Gemmatimonadota bacterium]|nr:hypothetical protein [Gemmatimonadota bacterium]
MRHSRFLLILVLYASVACASKPPAPGGQGVPPAAAQQAPQQTNRPLAGFAAQRLIVLPTRFLRTNDSLGWTRDIGAAADYLKTVDDELAFALRERGVQGTWVMASDVVKAAKRNFAYATDPYTLGEEPLRPPRKKPELLADPLASELRNLIALHDGVRYALLPVEVRFEKFGSQGRAVLHLAVIDVRMSKVLWSGDVVSDPSILFTPALAASLSVHVADMIASP